MGAVTFHLRFWSRGSLWSWIMVDAELEGQGFAPLRLTIGGGPPPGASLFGAFQSNSLAFPLGASGACITTSPSTTFFFRLPTMIGLG